MYRSCGWIEHTNLNFNGRVDIDNKLIGFCCEPIKNFPAIWFDKTAEETALNFLRLRDGLIEESKKVQDENLGDEHRVLSSGCATCPHYKLG